MNRKELVCRSDSLAEFTRAISILFSFINYNYYDDDKSLKIARRNIIIILVIISSIGVLVVLGVVLESEMPFFNTTNK
jgi:hypothetical protein